MRERSVDLLFASLNLRLPKAADLVAAPTASLDQDPVVLLAHHERIQPSHSVEPGLGPADRYPFAVAVASVLAPHFELVAPFSRPRGTGRRRVLRPRTFDGAIDEAPTAAVAEERRAVIARDVGAEISFDVAYQAEETRQAFVDVTVREFGLHAYEVAAPNPNVRQFVTPELRVKIVATHLGALGAPLAHSKRGRNGRREEDPTEVRRRQQDFRSRVAAAAHPSGMLIELDGKRKFKPGCDPKNALRGASTQTYHCAQFFTPEARGANESKFDHRMRNAFLDLIRQMGTLGAPLDVRIDDLDGPLDVIGVWCINPPTGSSLRRRTWSGLPVAVRLRGSESGVMAFAPGFDTWVSYRELLVRAGRGELELDLGISAAKAGTWLSDLVRSQRSRDSHSLILARAQNLRWLWKWLANGRITMDRVTLPDGSDWPVAAMPGVRIVRVRDSDDDETPEWYASGVHPGFATGIFEMQPRVYASSQGKPPQQQFPKNLPGPRRLRGNSGYRARRSP